jgi:ZIP family zinc transporter
MSPVLTLIIFTTIAGLAMPVGALFASIERIRAQWLERELRHTIIAFGGGVLLSAVALVLVPYGIEHLNIYGSALWFIVGGLAFMLLDRALAASKNSAAQLVAMLADFIPEAIAMGAAYATGSSTGMLLALLITLQNLPEGFNAYRELRASTKLTPRRIILAFTIMALLGPASGLLGYHLLADLPHIVGALMLAAAGGILYLTFNDIAPQAKLNNRFAPPMGAVTGFMLGLIGHMLLNG